MGGNFEVFNFTIIRMRVKVKLITKKPFDIGLAELTRRQANRMNHHQIDRRSFRAGINGPPKVAS